MSALQPCARGRSRSAEETGQGAVRLPWSRQAAQEAGPGRAVSHGNCRRAAPRRGAASRETFPKTVGVQTVLCWEQEMCVQLHLWRSLCFLVGETWALISTVSRAVGMRRSRGVSSTRGAEGEQRVQLLRVRGLGRWGSMGRLGRYQSC